MTSAKSAHFLVWLKKGDLILWLHKARKEELRREESSEENRKGWRWDDIFQVFRCPVCGRPEKPSMKLRAKSGVQYVLPQKCGYCGAQMEGVEAK